jgi:four helix bundle protein
MVKGFEHLQIWQRAKDLAVFTYKITENGDVSRAFGLRDQMRRSAVSVASNIAEGDERQTDKDAVRFFYIAKGSTAELRTQNRIAYEIGYSDKKDFETIDKECYELGKMIGGVIRHRN